MAEPGKRKAARTPDVEHGARPNSSTKRQRVSQACDQCRTAREKCDGIRPACSTCASSSRACSYAANPKKRGIQSGYIKVLEEALAWLFCNSRGCEEALRFALTTGDHDHPVRFRHTEPEVEAKDLHTVWRKSRFRTEVDRLLSGDSANGPPSLPDDGPVRFIGPHRSRDAPQNSIGPDSTAPAQLIDRLETVHSPRLSHPGLVYSESAGTSSTNRPICYSTAEPTSAGGTYTELSRGQKEASNGFACPDTGESLPPDSTSKGSSIPQNTRSQSNTAMYHSSGNSEDKQPFKFQAEASAPWRTRPQRPQTLKLPSNFWRLLDVYFAYTHSWFPIIDKQEVLKASYSYHERGLEHLSGARDQASHAQLWSVMALAAFQDDAGGASDASGAEQPANVSPHMILDTARQLIPSEDGCFEIGHAGALLLISLAYIGQNEYMTAWILVGKAVRVALPRKCANQTPDEGFHSNHPRRRLMLFGCFVVDTVLSAYHGCKRHLSRRDMHLLGILDEEGLEEWHPWQGCEGFGSDKSHSTQHLVKAPVHSLSIFNNLVHLVGILGDFSIRKIRNWHPQPTQDLIHELRSWELNLPEPMRFVGEGNIEDAYTPPSLNLFFTYNVLRLILGGHKDLFAARQIVNSLELHNRRFGLLTTPCLARLLIFIVKEAGCFDTLEPTEMRILETSLSEMAFSHRTGPSDEPQCHTLSRERLDGHGNYVLKEMSYGGVGKTGDEASNNSRIGFPHTRSSVWNSVFGDNRMQTTPHQDPWQWNTPGFPSLHNPLSENPHFTDEPSFIDRESYPLPHTDMDLAMSSSASFGRESTVDRSLGRVDSIDLEALSRDLASLESAESTQSQPEFMQNLGFAPNMNLNDISNEGYGYLDAIFFS
ncbi:hypothetical protein BDY21DRAFT_181884 [Lineolata rhizophorae]|uniref:Zn(2)-C6 fungal-type domain-containing protein n=1 Tax=Lineolata rhizophorae TaxID=578093 RepID=A0A6A6P7H3_9PEZI|nr:hypothetical protein BDY21DRAFT_181884 [Lineolata rhizophorae]